MSWRGKERRSNARREEDIPFQWHLVMVCLLVIMTVVYSFGAYFIFIYRDISFSKEQELQVLLDKVVSFQEGEFEYKQVVTTKVCAYPLGDGVFRIIPCSTSLTVEERALIAEVAESIK